MKEVGNKVSPALPAPWIYGTSHLLNTKNINIALYFGNQYTVLPASEP